ncbi:MAG: endospore germination permease [Desulfitobacteriaceae bacterium]|nr:endospore germination permease [Desulfitobacteriaceae bacterium]MDI6879308.1 endospore germination permease [Desulfitobacteriaceae bacterium]MDI6915260.1 endospore germination permease [Desulfitobacteriaceae bacterium]
MQRISIHQFMILSAAILLGTTFMPVAQATAQTAGRDAWLAVMPAYSLAIPWGYMILYLAKNHPGLTLMQIAEKLLGKWPGKGINLMYAGITGYFAALLSSQLVDLFRRSILPLVPTTVFAGGILLLVVILAWSEVEVFARFAEIVFPLIALGLIFTTLFSIPRFEWGEFLPILENGWMPVVWGALPIVPFAMEYPLFLAGMLAFLPQGEGPRLKAGIWRAVLLVGLLDTAITLTQTMVFGPEETKRLNYGLLALGKMIEISKTIAGVESIFMLVWMGASTLKITGLFLGAIWGIEQVTGWKRKGWVYIGVGFLLLGIDLNKPGGAALVLEIAWVDQYLILPLVAMGVPLLMVAEFWQRRRQRR